MKIHEHWWYSLDFDRNHAEKLALEGGLFLPVAAYLAYKNLPDLAEVTRFLEPDFHQVKAQSSFAMMDEAVGVILQGIRQGDRFLIYGDYDVDGITATTILSDYLTALGAGVKTFIPHRVDEGYGLSLEALEAIEDPFEILITVDCGITSVKEAAFLLAEGRRVIITDHHEPKEVLPGGIIVNPKLDPGAFQGLAGVGVALAMIIKLEEATGRIIPPDTLALACIGTVADLMPLEGLNRIIVSCGLKAVPQVKKPGLRALLEVKGIDPARVSASDIAFRIAPVLNASGRLDSAMKALRLLQTTEPEEAMALAKELDAINEDRKRLEGDMKDRALKLADSNAPMIIVSHGSFHEGVVGIVASRLVEALNRPALVFSDKGDHLKGSGRSLGDFNLLKALDAAKETIESYGGHQHAAGLKVRKEDFEAFKQQVTRYTRDHLAPRDQVRKFSYIAILGSGQIHRELLDQIEKLAPFGIANPRPGVLIEGVRIESLRQVGQGGEHLKIKFLLEQRVLDAIGFNMGDRVGVLKRGMLVDLIGTLKINRYLGLETLSLDLKDIREAGARFILDVKGYHDYIESHPGILKQYHRQLDRLSYFTYEYYSDSRITAKGAVDTVDYDRVGSLHFEDLADLKNPLYQRAFEEVFLRSLPDREALVGFYKGLKKQGRMTLMPVAREVGALIERNRILICASILEELKLIEMGPSREKDSFGIRPLGHSSKTALEKSQIYRNILQIKEDWHEFKRKNQGD